MKKLFYILCFVFTIGLLIMPIQIHACNNKIEKLCCQKNKTTQNTSKENCNKQSTKNNCSKNCQHCKCLTIHSTFFLLPESNKKIKKLFLDSQKNQIFSLTIDLSDGFISIWIPPNIG